MNVLDEHIVIGADRSVTIPNTLNYIGVQFDHNVESITFDCPRYWDGVDLSKMQIYVNYMRPDNVVGRHLCSNITVDSKDENIIHFKWLVSNHVTAINGPLTFLVCAVKTDANGNEINHWNSEISSDVFILEGMECTDTIVEQHPDIITQLLTRMGVVEQINVQADAMQKIYDDAVEVAAMAETVKDEALDASNHIKNAYANAFKGSAKGEILRFDDVSPVEHDVNCWVHGKNLLNIDFETKTHNGLTFTNNGDGSFTIDGTSTTGFGFVVSDDLVLPRGTYTLSVEKALPQGLNLYTISNGKTIDFIYGGNGTNVGTKCLEKESSRLRLWIAAERVFDNLVLKPQLEEGSVATDYEPYIDPETVNVTGCGKNLIPYPYMDTTKTQNGITFTDNGDGSITIDGTATGPAYFFLQKDVAYGEIINSILTDSANNGVYTASKRLYYNASTGTLTVNINSGMVISNEKIYPQLEVGLVATDYEPYSSSEFVPASDGACTVKSHSPTTTIFTNTPGVTIEAEYNRDSNAVYNELNTKLDTILSKLESTES